jgi:hypothetical protein
MAQHIMLLLDQKCPPSTTCNHPSPSAYITNLPLILKQQWRVADAHVRLPDHVIFKPLIPFPPKQWRVWAMNSLEPVTCD